MEQPQQIPSQHEPKSPTQREKAKVLQATRRVANEKRTVERLAPKYRVEALPQDAPERWEKGEWIPHKRVPLSEEERQQWVKIFLTGFNQRPPTAANYAAGASYYGWSNGDQQELDRAIKDALAGMIAGALVMNIAKGPLNGIRLRTVSRQVESLEAGMGGYPLRHCGRLVNLGIVHHHLEVQVGARKGLKTHRVAASGEGS